MHSSLFAEILSAPPARIAYSASQALSQRAPFVLETEDGSFDVEDFAKHGHASLRVLPTEHPLLSRRWRGERHPTKLDHDCAWLEVVYDDVRFEVVRLEWLDSGCTQRRTFILGPSHELTDGLFRAVCTFATATVAEEIVVFEDGDFCKNEDLHRAIRSATFDSLVLVPELERALKDDFTTFFSSRDVYERYAVPWRRGALFVGPPGNGKTHAIKALVGSLGKPCLYVKSLVSRCETDHAALRRIFERAREMAPCVLVLEDLDSIVNNDNRSFFLNELDGFADNHGVSTIATTNHAERLDPALVDRPSRFDRTYRFALPDPLRRAAFLERWSTRLDEPLRLSREGVGRATEMTNGFSFAYLKELGTACLLAWMREAQPMDLVIEAQARLLSSHVRRGDTSRVLAGS